MKYRMLKKQWFFIVLVLFLSISQSYAGLVLGGTRLIFDGSRQEASIKVTNKDKKPTLVQSWVSNDSDNKKSDVFLVTPPLFRLESESSNSLRVVQVKSLPQDRESLYWLNVKGIPPTDPSAKNTLSFAINTQIKLIYRPKDLTSSEASNAYKKLKFTIKNGKLNAENATPYYINIQSISVAGKEIPVRTIAPFSTAIWSELVKSGQKIEWNSVNDYGGYTDLISQQLK